MRKKWRSIDNTAKIFSLDFKKNANVFRFSILLKSKVSKEILEAALINTLDKYQSFKVKLKMGLFWNYFEYNDKVPVVCKNANDLERFDYGKNNDYLFKVSYDSKKINVDFYHLLTDGAGAVNFITALITNYLKIKNNVYIETENKYEVSYKDPLLEKYVKVTRVKEKEINSFLLKEECNVMINNAYLYTVPVNDVKMIAKSKGATITEFLTAVFIFSIYRSLYDKSSSKEISLTVPIDIRKIYEVDTLSNFFVCMKVNSRVFEKKISSFEEILEEVKYEFKNNLTEEKIKGYLANEVELGQNIAYRYVPGFIKKFCMGYLGKYFGRSTTSTLSNLGIIKLDDCYKKDIDNIYALVMPGRLQKIKCTICTFNDNLNIMMNSNIDDIKFEKEFYKKLKKNFKKVKVISNVDSDILR